MKIDLSRYSSGEENLKRLEPETIKPYLDGLDGRLTELSGIMEEEEDEFVAGVKIKGDDATVTTDDRARENGVEITGDHANVVAKSPHPNEIRHQGTNSTVRTE